MKRIFAAVVIVGALGLAGCSAPKMSVPKTESTIPLEDVPVSLECVSAFHQLRIDYAAAGEDIAAANQAELGPLNACISVNEYTSGAKGNPGSVGFEFLNDHTAEITLTTACLGVDKPNATPVCADAKAKGFLDG